MAGEPSARSGTPAGQDDPLAIEFRGGAEKIRIGGHVLCHWMTGLGYTGYSPAQVQLLLHSHLGLDRVKESTIQSRVGDGYTRGRGKQTAHSYRRAALTAAELAAVEKRIGPPSAREETRGPDPGGEHGVVLPEQVVGPTGLFEGSIRTITVNGYERNPAARWACVAHHGTRCCVCGFDFVAVYGPIMAGYIQAHHLRPLSEIGSEYEVDPIADLRPVCPNCHAVIHHGGKCREIEIVRQMLL